MKDKYLYIFLHIPKTAGTTLIKHIEKNYNKDERLCFGYDKLGLDPFKLKNKECTKEIDEYFSKLSPKRKKKLRVIYGHLISYGIHRHFNKKARYLTILRDPYDRSISYYNYNRSLYESEGIEGRKKKIYRYNLLINGEIPSFDDWLEKKYAQKDNPFSNLSIYDYLKLLKFSEDGNRDVLLKRIFDKFYFVGITERFKIDSLYLYSMLNINKYFVNQNISKDYIPKSYSKKLKETQSKIMETDYKIYRYALKINDKFKKDNKQIKNKTRNLMIRRKLMLPFTQLLFDTRDNLGKLSSILRKVIPGYSRLWDYTKSIFIDKTEGTKDG